MPNDFLIEVNQVHGPEVVMETSGVEIEIIQAGDFEVFISPVVMRNGNSENSAVQNEVPQGLRNGSNALFTTTYSFIPETVEVFINGLKQHPVAHFQTSGTQNIMLSDSPGTTDLITVNYFKA